MNTREAKEMFYCVENGDTGRLGSLLRKGNPPDVVDYDGSFGWPGYALANVAAELGNCSAVKLLLQFGLKNRSFVEDAARHGRKEIIDLWLTLPGSKGQVDVVLDANGNTLLLLAAKVDVESVRCLVMAGASLAHHNKDGRDAMAVAQQYDKDDVVAFLCNVM